MTSLQARLKAIRSEENGWTMAQVVVVFAILPMFFYVFLTCVAPTAEASSYVANKTMGINQGVVGDTTTEIYNATGQFMADHPGVELTKEALVSEGYVDVDASYVWNVHTYGLTGEDFCVIAYSTTEQTEEFTATVPAEQNAHGFKKATGSAGCWGTDEDGDYLPNWS